MNLCDDNRIITIEKAKQALIKGTNIEDSPEEMKVLDNILLRCWQMGWLDRYDQIKTIEPSTNCSEFPNNSDTISRAKAIEALDKRFDSIPMEQTSEILMLRKDLRELPPAQQPMPSNTSNALKTLDSVNATQSNALGEQTNIEQEKMIVESLPSLYPLQEAAIKAVIGVISSNHENDLPDTNVGEMITKQQVIDVLERVKRTANDILYDGPVLMSYNDVLDSLINIVNFLPPAQPEKRTEERTETYACDSISRQAAIDAVQNRPMMLSKEKVLLINDLEKLPPAEPKRIRGRWIYSSYDDESGFDESWTCDKCGYSTNIEETNYCPKCGADMREVKE